MTRNLIVPYNPKLRQKARELRKNPTFSEKVQWTAIRQKQLGNEFHRQVPIDEYIVDFYCHELLLAIEIDGISHDTDKAKIKDEIRQKKLRVLGLPFYVFVMRRSRKILTRF